MQGGAWPDAAWIVAALALIAAVVAGLADRRRARRRDPDRIGWVPWHGIVLAALFVFAMAVAYGLQG